MLREFTLPEPARDIIWSHGELVVCGELGVYILDGDGTERRRIMTAAPGGDDAGAGVGAAPGGPGVQHGCGPFSPLSAVIVSGHGTRPQQLAVLDVRGNIHLFR